MKKRAWRGLLCLSGSILALSLAAGPVVNNYRTNIDSALGTQSTKIVATDKSEDVSKLYSFTSDYKNTKELVEAVADIGERAEEEGIVLLKNKNDNVLPLTTAETKKVSLLGFSSYFPIQGGDMGSSLTENKGTDADTVDLVSAFKAKNFGINETVESMYTSESAKAMFKTEVSSWGRVFTYYHITAPATDGVFSSKDPNPTLLDTMNSSWRSSVQTNNTVIVTIARSAGENKTYLPGKAGVDPSQNLNQTDPLGLSDDERSLIKTAKQLAGSDGKVVVLLNNASALEIDELKNSDDVDAMLEIGLPGGYGFYGVADVLTGAAVPSGRLSDTYAVCNSKAPSAQNYGDLQWANAGGDNLYVNDALVESESIYDGYYYYETRYADTVLGQGNATSSKGATKDSWSYDSEVSYPFGYGKSYTTFKQTLKNVNVNLSEKKITAEVEVENTGSKYTGKDAVQLYVSLPWAKGQVEKSAIQLVDFTKTDDIKPGEKQTVTIEADAQYLASWDSDASNALGTKGNYTMDAGDYCFSVGNAHEALNNVLTYKGADATKMAGTGDGTNVKVWNLASKDTTTFAETKNGTKVENQLDDMDLNSYDGFDKTVTYLSRSDWDGTFPKTYKDLTASDAMIKLMNNDITKVEKDDTAAPTFDAKNNLTLADLKGVTDMNDPRWEKLMDQIGLFDCMVRLGFGGTSTKSVSSILSPEAVQNDGPNGIYSYTLGKYASKKADSKDPYCVEEDDKNANFQFGTMPNETVLAQTFSKKIAEEYGKVAGNYSLWANLPIWWGCGTNLHRTPYNARNHEYYSEDPVLTAEFGTVFVQAGLKYGLLIAPKHFAFNDTEINRTGVAVFMTEQKARQLELRGTQACIEDGALALMTAFNRVGCLASNSHYNLMQNILRKEWGFNGLISEDFIQNADYSSPKEAAHCGVTMTCNTGESTAAALSAKWSFMTVENISKDNSLCSDFKQAMTWQFYAIAQSNAMDGLSSSSKIVSVMTWYDVVLLIAQILFGIATAACLVMYVMAFKKEEK